METHSQIGSLLNLLLDMLIHNEIELQTSVFHEEMHKGTYEFNKFGLIEI